MDLARARAIADDTLTTASPREYSRIHSRILQVRTSRTVYMAGFTHTCILDTEVENVSRDLRPGAGSPGRGRHVEDGPSPRARAASQCASNRIKPHAPLERAHHLGARRS